jgi:hypothetical protein
MGKQSTNIGLSFDEEGFDEEVERELERLEAAKAEKAKAPTPKRAIKATAAVPPKRRIIIKTGSSSGSSVKALAQDNYAQLRATGLVPAAPWVLHRVSVPISGRPMDARKPTDLAIWPDMASEISDKEVQQFWLDASTKYSYPSEWDASSARGTIAVALKGGGNIDHDLFVKIKRSAQAAREEIVSSLIGEVGQKARAFPASIGVVGLLEPLGSPGTRPGFTLIVSSPSGGSDAAQVLLRGFQERGISNLLARQIQENQYGVIRGLFLPEWLCHYRDQNAGIDWEIWQPVAQSNFESNFYEAMLVWCDEILKAILELKKEWRFLIDNVFFDSYSAIVLVNNNVKQTINEISRMNKTTRFSASEICRFHIKSAK